MTTVDLLVQMLAEEREEARRAQQDRVAADESYMRMHMKWNAADADLRNAETSLEEWRNYAGVLRLMLVAKRVKQDAMPEKPAQFTREIPF